MCPNCGTENAAASRFCDSCGASLAAACPNCGESNRAGAHFCANCGTNLTEVTTTATASAPAYAQQEARSAERRFVTVLFVDLVGFTPFAEERDPELVRETLDKYFGLARLAIERHGGTIEKFIGDAVMAVWGTPAAHEDDAERAVRAALELVDSVHSLGPAIQARAGITSGEAAVTIGAQGQGMVAGDLVNTASRLQSVAPAGSVLVSEPTMRSAEAAINFEAVGEQELKGKSAPVAAFRAVRVVANRGGESRSENIEAPFVGREEELRQLKEVLHATSRDQRVRLVSIFGPAGIGKSRLTWELEKYIDGLVETILWHRGRSPAYGEGITFWALGEIVRRRAQLTEADDEATTRERLAATVAQFVADEDERLWIQGALLTLLGLEPAPAGGRDALFAAWRIFFERIAATGTTALVFEDVQWADAGLLDFIEHILDWSKNLPLLVITLSRPELVERRPGWGSGHRFTTALTLEPLTDGQMRELLGGLAPGLPDIAVENILRRADGIPLYAVEIVRMLVADGKLELVDGAYRPTGDLVDVAVPETLRSLIASRLDSLDPSDRALLQDASVLGQRFSLALLSAVSGVAPETLEPRLRSLARREFLDMEVDSRSPERGQYGFVQSLIREVAYATLGRRERRGRHLAAARYFEALGDDELAGVLATHYLAAYETSTEGAERDAVGVQARLALHGAAHRAFALGSHEQAIAFAEQALHVTSNPGERGALFELAADAANSSSNARAEEFGRAALAARRDAGHQEDVVASTAKLGRILIDLGRLNDAIHVMENAGADEPAAVDGAATAALQATLSRAYMRAERGPESIAVADQALVTAERLNLDAIVAEALVNKGASLGAIGRRRESRALLQVGVEIAARLGLVELELRGRNNLSVAQYDDDPKAALATVLEGIEIGTARGERAVVNWQAGSAAMYSLGIGDAWDPALARIEEVLASRPQPHDRARALAIKALYAAYRGRSDIVLEEAIEAAREGSEPQVPATVEWAQALGAFFGGRYDEARTRALRAGELWHKFKAQCAMIALRSALLGHDQAGALAAIALLEENTDSGADATGARMAVSAARAALEGRTNEAASGYRAAADVFRDAGFHLMQAEAIADAMTLLPPGSVPAASADEARAIFERVDARRWLELLELASAQRELGQRRRDRSDSVASEAAARRA